MTDCSHPDIRDRLPDLAADRVPAGERSGIERHLEKCAPCRQELTVLQSLLAAEIPDPGHHFWASLPERVVREVEAEAAGQRARPFLPVDLFRRPLFRAAAVAGLAAAVTVMVFWPRAVMDNGFRTQPGEYIARFQVMELGTETELILATGSDLESIDSVLEEELALDPMTLYPEEETALLGVNSLAVDQDSLGALEEIIDEILPAYMNRG